MLHLDCKCPIPRLLATLAGKKTLRAHLLADSAQLWKLDAVKRGHLLQADLRHQFVDVHETSLSLCHAAGNLALNAAVCYAPPPAMTNNPPRRHVTGRDLQVLQAFDRSPLTVEQILKLSETFNDGPFTSVRSVQDRLHKLCASRWVRRWRYATATQGSSPHYYKLTLLGLRILYGDDAQPTTKRQFHEVGISHQHHTRSLADFIVHALVGAHRSGVLVRNFYRENTLRLNLGDETLYPDAAFELATPDERQYNFLVELDNGTERVRSDKDVESWERKIRLYDELQTSNYPKRFRVLILTTRSGERLRHILSAAGALVRNRQRSLFYGAFIADYLACEDPIASPSFLNHFGKPVSLIPPSLFTEYRTDWPDSDYHKTQLSATVRGPTGRRLPTSARLRR